jgi:HAD superfamily hydrolase (TIGR01509 family)
MIVRFTAPHDQLLCPGVEPGKWHHAKVVLRCPINQHMLDKHAIVIFMIKAIIFDMDGLLIDSEPFWEEAELDAFTAAGVPLTHEMKKQTTGLRADEVVQYWYSRYPWERPSCEEITTRIIGRVSELVKSRGLPRDGVYEIINLFYKKGLPMAIASSSHETIINSVLDKLSIRDYMSAIYSAQHEKYGKPHPGVYITATEMLDVRPENCLAFEDSPNGVLAAKSAKMKCVAVPDEELKKEKAFCIADKILGSLLDFDDNMLEELS